MRVDTHVYSGYRVPPYYDSLLAKLVVWGNTRQEAVARGREALDSFVVEGIFTTIGYLSNITQDKAFQEGSVDTSFVDRFGNGRG